MAIDIKVIEIIAYQVIIVLFSVLVYHLFFYEKQNVRRRLF